MRSRSASPALLALLLVLPACRERSAARAAPLAEAAGPAGRLSFISERDGNREVYLIRADGQDERRLTFGPSADVNGPASPDGAALLVLSVEQGGPTRLLLLPIGARPGAAPRLLRTANRLRAPSLSPDGRWLVVESGGAEAFCDLYRLDVTGGQEPLRLTANPEGNFEPALSPRGDAIAFVSSRDRAAELYRMRPDGSEVVRLTHTARDEWGPRFSPDGTLLAFGSDRDGADRLYVMPAAGGAARRVSDEGPDVRTVEEAPAWAPSGRRLAYVLRRLGERPRVLIVDLESGARTELRAPDGRAAAEPAWSPDGRWLAFTALAPGTSHLFIARPDGSEARQLTRGPGPDWGPRWIPD